MPFIHGGSVHACTHSPKVSDLDLCIRGVISQQKVVRLEVAVCNTQLMAVCNHLGVG
jgi:hypothetical protein